MQLNKHEWGIPMYNPKAKVRELIKSKAFTTPKAKYTYFMEQAEIDKKWVPGCASYKLDYNWKNNPDFRLGKMGLGLTTKRETTLAEIYSKSKYPEKCSPGPAAYDNHTQKLKQMPKIPGNYANDAKRKVFIDDVQALSNTS